MPYIVMATIVEGHSLIPGKASGKILFSDAALSFWGGVSAIGEIVDHHHPLRGQVLTNTIVAIPSGRGSCTGSGAILELLVSGKGPAGFVFRDDENILTLGVLVAKTVFNISIPVLRLTSDDFSSLSGHDFAQIDGGSLYLGQKATMIANSKPSIETSFEKLRLGVTDQAMLEGKYGLAKRMAMEILVEFAKVQQATELIDVTQAHIDACIYIGPAGLQFAQHFASLDAKFSVPTTLNSISIDRRRWKELGLTREAAQPAEDLAKAYMSMGAQTSFTCAPYLLETAPKQGEQIGWAESNAVVFANSVLGARTQKYPDFLDVCIALTGRAPLSGCHRDRDRMPTVLIELPSLKRVGDATFPLLGYLIGQLSGSEIPLIFGLENTASRTPDLKAFGAGFATSSSAPMFHIRGITPESEMAEKAGTAKRHVQITSEDIDLCERSLNTAQDPAVDLVSLGNPHFSIEEFADLARLCKGRLKHQKVSVVVTTSRAVQSKAEEAGYLGELSRFGVDVITDTCWCMIDEPVIPRCVRNLMTNSAKYAHYAPGMVQRGVHFGSLSQCVEAACSGEMIVLNGWTGAETK